jgi:GNAT superfamily N-acetyltransferase
VSRPPRALVRPTEPADFPGIIAVCRSVYPESPAWTEAQLQSHHQVFPEGQLVAVSPADGRILGMAASLIVLWDDYEPGTPWRDFTDHGTFRNHDPERGRTLYGAEVMVDPAVQGQGVGSLLYQAREALARRLGLLRIRAGARLRGYHRFADSMSAEDYVIRVARGELTDPTLSFQLRRGFRVLAVAPGYLVHDPESRGYAAVIEWLNPEVASPADRAAGDPRYRVTRG